MKQEKLLKYENAKLKHQLIFSMPAGNALCGRECKNCYAIKFQKMYPSVLPYRQRRYEASTQPDFASRIIAEIIACKKPVTAIRIHESSEFYSQQYIDKWTAIAKSLPQYIFYAYTKRLSEFDFTSFKSLPNVVIINSLPNGKINYGKTPPAGMFVCPATNSAIQCGIDCTWCQTKNCADLHGVWFTQH